MLIRRVVTGTLADGTAAFVHDGPPPHVVGSTASAGVETALLWASDGPMALPTDGSETTRLDRPFFPDAGGTRFLVMHYQSGFGMDEPESATATAGRAGPPSARLYLHETATVDYAIVISGEICAVLASGEERALTTGDVLIQNGVSHAWRNRSAEVAVVAFVIVGARR